MPSLPPSPQPQPPPQHPGWRARKRDQTRQRIAEAGLRLFLEQGFEATTLDAIASAAGIARRTFFHYFDSKEALLFAYEDAAEASFRAALATVPDTLAPLAATAAAMQGMLAGFTTDRARDIDRIVEASDHLRARKQAYYERLETAALAALAEKFPAPAEALPLRLAAMVAIGALRIAAERWRADGGLRPLQDYVNETLLALPYRSG